MKNIKYIFIAILFVAFLFSCTAEDTIEDDLTNTTQEDQRKTGDDSEDGTADRGDG